MDINYTPEDEVFRSEVKTFLEAELPKDLSDKVRAGQKLDGEDFMRWQRILGQKGWLAPRWPQEHGGCGWTPMQVNIFDEEAYLAGAPRVLPFGVNMVGPVIIEFGSEDQKARHLPGIARGEVPWCQGFSEPGSGSDLASLKTAAVRDGDDFIVNGQKIWTSYAHFSDWMFCLVRTDPNAAKKQQGISFLLIDMKTPGITVRPIITFDGMHSVNEVFLEKVRVPAENLVGEENKGWDYAKFLLGHERTGIAGVGGCKAEFEKLLEIARTEKKNGKPLIEDPLFAAKIARLEIDLRALELTNMRMLSGSGTGLNGAFPSVLKIKGTEVQQRIAELQMDAVGVHALPWQQAAMDPAWNSGTVGPDYAIPRMPAYIDRRKATIYGGSTEIQKNIISKALLS
ncbi:acyl-CoA dehydrogenase family protein [Roseibium alexandrii]|uniref:Acyl-CoA dehydrogenase n=1 Tax=Roseibium alexandrii (strain DSM 17067 / NCIMB 14079 / DFL-11) TaxID=244592 RepID=A0A5E8H1I5_ROSAD|nr:acyl-CoA dehydrogenase family protein [Roseibium alexandrii]EEE45712.1 Acyl-CoA dehydrogenase [Roseibium alexandrii DFL-11]